MPVLDAYWPELVDHPEQSRLWDSDAMYRVLAAGRGGGKGENAGRMLFAGDEHHRGAIDPPNVPQPMFWIAAPTRDQVKMIWWDRLKGLVPRECIAAVSESELWIRLKVGSTIRLIGLDKPHRAEGAMGVDGLIVDEYAEVRANAWESSLEPAVNRRNRRGWVLFIGRPKGRGHFYDRWAKAKVEDEWDSFHWTSEPVLGREHLEKIRRNCDELVFRQEYLADWVNFVGLAYYPWDPNLHYRSLSYDPKLPLIACFDFNVEPGVCAILQEQDHKHPSTGDEIVRTTCAIDEVHLARNSRTARVCRELLLHIKSHAGDVLVYGDPSGGARKSSSEATDWEIVRQHLHPVFGDRLRWRVAKRQPYIRDRVNAMNSRLKSTSGHVRFLADPTKVPHIVKDFEGVQLLEGGSGEVDKKGAEDAGLSHLSEAIGYYIHEKHPIGSGPQTVIY